jgi:hypothetical protein
MKLYLYADELGAIGSRFGTSDYGISDWMTHSFYWVSGI